MLLDRIWFWLLLVGILYGFGKAVYTTAVFEPQPPAPPTLEEMAQDFQALVRTDVLGMEAEAEHEPKPPLIEAGQRLTDAAINAAQTAVEICLSLIGVMALWLGMLKIAERAGMVDALAWALRPAMRWLFPDVPDGHPAQGAMLMNISANMLGLDNAATPFGLQAMRELQELNPQKDTATNAMATFLAINTSSVTLLPISIIALRAAAGSDSPASPIGGMFLATCVSTFVAIVAVRTLQELPRFAAAAGESSASNAEAE